MKKVFLRNTPSVLLFALIALSSQKSSAQCSIFNNTDCTSFGGFSALDFNSSTHFFSSPDLAYSGTDFRGTVAGSGTNTYVVNSRSFILQSGINAAPFGFSTAGSTATFTNYAVEVHRYSDGALLASCPTNANPVAGPVCYSVTDANLVNGINVYFTFRLTVNNSNGQTVIFDNFTFNAGQTPQPLPVELAAFTASRKKDIVDLDWTTASESNSRGFEIEKRTGATGGFKTIGFVASTALNGNSSASISYHFTDASVVSENTYYRLKQTDLDGKYKYSDILAVNGNDIKGGIFAYPNPSDNGHIRIVFTSSLVKDIQLLDASGRVVKEWKAFTQKDLNLDLMKSGLYLLRVNYGGSSEAEVKKIIVNK
jgi:hypothetical protein